MWLMCPLHRGTLVSETRDRVFHVYGYDIFQALGLVVVINFLQLNNYVESIYWLHQDSN